MQRLGRPSHLLVRTLRIRSCCTFSVPSPPTPPRKHVHGVHAFECPDQVGITARIAECIAKRGASIMDVDVHVNRDLVREPAFFARTYAFLSLFLSLHVFVYADSSFSNASLAWIHEAKCVVPSDSYSSEFVFDPSQWPRDVMEDDFLRLKNVFKAKYSVVRVPEVDPRLKIAVLVSWKDPCLVDLLHLWQEGKIPVQILCIVSNHVREEDTHVIRLLTRHNIPYHFVPSNKDKRQEKEILSLVADSDFLVLAHYMQVLSPEFLKAYGRDIINIHHGLLPSFKGANPYKQAYEAGVKLIGATSHFVTEELDGGPIIEQMVERVSHRDLLDSFAMKSEYLEKACLVRAIKYYCELRIIRYGGKKTIVFD